MIAIPSIMKTKYPAPIVAKVGLTPTDVQLLK